MKVKIPSPKSEFVKKAFVILVTGILPFSLIVNKQKEDSSKSDNNKENLEFSLSKFSFFIVKPAANSWPP